MEDYLSQNEIEDENIERQKKDKYDLSLDYYSKNNPFSNILIASSII